jgi:beta-hydroxylase
MRFRWAGALNRWLGKTMMTAASSPNEEGDQVGLVSKLFRISFTLGRYRRRFKAWNKTVYRMTKVALIAATAALIVFA